jgi:hypothetical protein
MNENEAQKRARDAETAEENLGPTQKLRDQSKSDEEALVTGKAGVPGMQKPGHNEIQDETNPNTE